MRNSFSRFTLVALAGALLCGALVSGCNDISGTDQADLGGNSPKPEEEKPPTPPPADAK